MRRIVPRLFNFISFILCLLIFVPWSFADSIENIEYLRLLLPLVVFFISLFFFIVSIFDRRSGERKRTISKPLVNATYSPILYLGILVSFVGLLNSIIYKTSVAITKYDYFGIVYRLFGTVAISHILSIIIYGVLFLVQVLLLIFINHFIGKKSFIVRFLMWILVILLAGISLKGLTSLYSYDTIYTTLIAMFNLIRFDNPYFLSIKANVLKYDVVYLYISLSLMTLYVSLGLILIGARKISIFDESEIPIFDIDDPIDKNKIKIKKKKTDRQTFAVPTIDDDNNEVEEYKEEHIFDTSDLDTIFNHKFNFNNVVMAFDYTDKVYFVNNQEFLRIDDNGSMSFILNLDKSIRLMIQYPNIMKEKYSNNKIWFRIGNYHLIDNNSMIQIVNDAYYTILYANYSNNSECR